MQSNRLSHVRSKTFAMTLAAPWPWAPDYVGSWHADMASIQSFRKFPHFFPVRNTPTVTWHHEMRFSCLTLVLTYIGRLDFMLCCFFSTVRLRFIPSYRIHFSSMPPLCVISYCLLDWFTVVFYFGGFQHWLINTTLLYAVSWFGAWFNFGP